MDFYVLTPIEFFAALKFYNEEREDEMHMNYDVARFMLKHLWNMQGRHVKKMLKTPKDVEEFPWETEKSKKVMTPEEMGLALRSIFRSVKNREKRNERYKQSQKQQLEQRRKKGSNEHRSPNS